MHNGLTIQRSPRSIAKQPSGCVVRTNNYSGDRHATRVAVPSLVGENNGNTKPHSGPASRSVRIKSGAAFGLSLFFVLICSRFVLFIFFSPYISRPARAVTKTIYIIRIARAVTKTILYYSFARAVTKRTKREQNTAEEQNVNKMRRVEQNVNVQKSSKIFILRQYDAAFLCILSRMSQ